MSLSLSLSLCLTLPRGLVGAAACQFFLRLNYLEMHRTYGCAANPQRARPLCDHCGREFCQPQKLKVHIKRMHSDMADVLRDFQCKLCAKILGSRAALQRHNKEVHHQFVNANTNSNNNASPAAAAAAEHHSGANSGGGDGTVGCITDSISCSRCGKTFQNKSNLKIHMLTHSGVKPFRCLESECKSAFTTKQCLQFHYRKVHGFPADRMPKIVRSVAYTFDAYAGEAAANETQDSAANDAATITATATGQSETTTADGRDGRGESETTTKTASATLQADSKLNNGVAKENVRHSIASLVDMNDKHSDGYKDNCDNLIIINNYDNSTDKTSENNSNDGSEYESKQHLQHQHQQFQFRREYEQNNNSTMPSISRQQQHGAGGGHVADDRADACAQSDSATMQQMAAAVDAVSHVAANSSAANMQNLIMSKGSKKWLGETDIHCAEDLDEEQLMNSSPNHDLQHHQQQQSRHYANTDDEDDGNNSEHNILHDTIYRYSQTVVHSHEDNSNIILDVVDGNSGSIELDGRLAIMPQRHNNTDGSAASDDNIDLFNSHRVPSRASVLVEAALDSVSNIETSKTNSSTGNIDNDNDNSDSSHRGGLTQNGGGAGAGSGGGANNDNGMLQNLSGHIIDMDDNMDEYSISLTESNLEDIRKISTKQHNSSNSNNNDSFNIARLTQQQHHYNTISMLSHHYHHYHHRADTTANSSKHDIELDDISNHLTSQHHHQQQMTWQDHRGIDVDGASDNSLRRSVEIYNNLHHHNMFSVNKTTTSDLTSHRDVEMDLHAIRDDGNNNANNNSNSDEENNSARHNGHQQGYQGLQHGGVVSGQDVISPVATPIPRYDFGGQQQQQQQQQLNDLPSDESEGIVQNLSLQNLKDKYHHHYHMSDVLAGYNNGGGSLAVKYQQQDGSNQHQQQQQQQQELTLRNKYDLMADNGLQGDFRTAAADRASFESIVMSSAATGELQGLDMSSRHSYHHFQIPPPPALPTPSGGPMTPQSGLNRYHHHHLFDSLTSGNNIGNSNSGNTTTASASTGDMRHANSVDLSALSTRSPTSPQSNMAAATVSDNNGGGCYGNATSPSLLSVSSGANGTSTTPPMPSNTSSYAVDVLRAVSLDLTNAVVSVGRHRHHHHHHHHHQMADMMDITRMHHQFGHHQHQYMNPGGVGGNGVGGNGVGGGGVGGGPGYPMQSNNPGGGLGHVDANTTGRLLQEHRMLSAATEHRLLTGEHALSTNRLLSDPVHQLLLDHSAAMTHQNHRHHHHHHHRTATGGLLSPPSALDGHQTVPTAVAVARLLGPYGVGPFQPPPPVVVPVPTAVTPGGAGGGVLNEQDSADGTSNGNVGGVGPGLISVSTGSSVGGGGGASSTMSPGPPPPAATQQIGSSFHPYAASVGGGIVGGGYY